MLPFKNLESLFANPILLLSGHIAFIRPVSCPHDTILFKVYFFYFKFHPRVFLVHNLPRMDFHALPVVPYDLAGLQAIEKHLEGVVQIRPHALVVDVHVELEEPFYVLPADGTLRVKGCLILPQRGGLGKRAMAAQRDDAVGVGLGRYAPVYDLFQHGLRFEILSCGTGRT